MSVSLCHLPKSLGVLWVAITRNVNICVGKIPGISIRECLKAAVETRLVCDSRKVTDTRQVIGARLDVGVCLCGSCIWYLSDWRNISQPIR